jgi:hypothetical protein
MDSPYNRTLTLDADTYVAENIEYLFDILEHYNFALSQAPARHTERPPEPPEWFPEYNAGVIVFDSSRATEKLFNKWLDYYSELNYNKGQPGLRKALYNTTDLNFYTLMREFNVRTSIPGSIDNTAKILHDRPNDLRDYAKRLNTDDSNKVYYKKGDDLIVKSNETPFYSRLVKSVRQDGITSTLIKGINMIAGQNN